MSIKLTDTQLVMLSAAARRDDRCLVAPQNLKGGAMHKVAAKLVTAGLVKEVKAKAGMAIWRRDDAIGQAYALKLTAAGAKAIAVDEGSAPNEARKEESPPTGRGEPAGAAPSPSAPRDGTKLALAVGLIRRDHGATLAELVAATGWLAAYHPRRAHRPAQARLRRDDRPNQQGAGIDLPHRCGAGRRRGEDTAQSDEPPATPAARPKPKKAERAAASPARQAA